MSDFLDALERQLIDVVEQRAGLSASRQSSSGGWRQVGPRRIALGGALSALAVLIVLLLAGALGGSSGPTRAARSPVRVVSGLPPQGHARLASLNVADPVGGAPWGMRIVRTATNLVCLQIGQFAGGKLRVPGGVVGDGVVHVLPPPAPPPSVVGNGLVETRVERASPREPRPPAVENCKPAGARFIAYGSGVALHVPGASRAEALAQRRTIAFGLLGPAARSVSYRFRGRSRSQRVEPGTGAYLIVLPDATAARILAVTYRDGETVCERPTEPVSAEVRPTSLCPVR